MLQIFPKISTLPTPPPPPPASAPNVNVPTFSFANVPLRLTEVINATKNLQAKKTADLTGTSVWLLQQIINEISSPLLHIFQQSFSTGVVPHQLKTAKVIPVFKSGQKELLDNYRPISLLNCFSKIIEKIVCTRLTDFLDSNNLISDFQFGFRKKHSTIHPLVHFLNSVSSALDKKEHAIAIFCDLRKAFDTVNHKILLDKMKKLGIDGVELRWFESYLANRRQLVHISGQNSNILEISTGVPQGSILGPLLFLIYINDLPLCSELIALLFADDTTLILSDPDIDSLIARVNSAFKLVCNFFRYNKLALHPAKTKFMLFTNSNEVKNKNFNIVLDFNNDDSVPDPTLVSNLERVNVDSKIPAIKFLGIFIDPQLSFKFHIDFLIGKVSKAMYFLRSVKNTLTPQALKAAYYAIVHSHFIYGIQVWSCTSIGNLNGLIKKQKYAIRTICHAKYNEHTEPLFKNLNILPLNLLIDYFKLQFMYKFCSATLPNSFANTWKLNSERPQGAQRMQLRNHNEIFVPSTRLTSTEKSPLIAYPRLWNNFGESKIKESASLPSFNYNLKIFFISKLSNVPICNRLLCPTCHLP